MNKDKQHAKLLKTMTKADACVDRHTAQKLITKADKIQSKLDKQRINTHMSTTILLGIFSGFAMGSIAASLIIK